MLYSEFTKLAGFEVRESYYHNIIEPDYNRSTLDKAEFVKKWKKEGGIQKAYNTLSSDFETICERNKNQQNVVREAREEAFDYRNKFEDVKEKLHNIKAEYNDLNDAYNCAMSEKNELAYFMLEQSEKSSNAELRAKVIEMIGFKAYIDYKFEHDMCIWQLDRDEIMKHL